MLKLIYCLSFCTLFFFFGCTPSVDDEIEPGATYVKYYGRNGLDEGIQIINSSAGGVTVLGQRTFGGATTNQITLYRMDSVGTLLLDNAYPESSDATYNAHKFLEDPSGNYVVVGTQVRTNANGDLIRRGFIMKVNADLSLNNAFGDGGFQFYGQENFDLVGPNGATFERIGNHEFWDIATITGGYAIAGSTNNVATDKTVFNEDTDINDAWVLLLDNDGNFLDDPNNPSDSLSHVFGYPESEVGLGIIITANEQIAVMGTTSRSAFNENDEQLGGQNIFFTLLDFEGQTFTTEIFGSENSSNLNIVDAPVDFIEDGNGFTILSNNGSNNAFIYQRTATGKESLEGELNVSTSANGENTAFASSRGSSILRTSRGEYIVTGAVQTQLNSVGGTEVDRGTDMLIMGLNQDLTVNNNRVFNYGGQEDDVSNDVIQLANGDLMVLGTVNFENGNTMITLMKTNERGIIRE